MYNHSINDKINVTTKEISCQGNESPYDHPLIYLKIPEDKKTISCPYCSRQFILNN